ncbi:MAG: hypothetical protein Q4G62_01095 [Pseudomonadota bacterium]|nr:hypothetical protein [Pseudomonadota bacterium]
MSRIQIRPPIELAIGQLTHLEQSHVQVALRMAAARLPVPCFAVLKDHAEITLIPHDEATILLSAEQRQIRIERPLRIAPFYDALLSLIQSLQPSADPAPVGDINPDATPGSGNSRLIVALLECDLCRPARIRLSENHQILVDANNHSAYFNYPSSELLDLAKLNPEVHITSISEHAFQQLKHELQPRNCIQIEQICWSTLGQIQTMTLLDKWHENQESWIQLDSWPNLSHQRDMANWLRVMHRLARSPMTISNAYRLAVEAGITAQRARHGLSMLLSYRRARVMALPAPPITLHPVRQYATPKAPVGLLGRLRARLRAATG